MRLVMTLLVRDEQELLAANLDYHLRQGVDFVLVSDHGSTDATPQILEDYVGRGVARVLPVEGEALDQGGWVTRMARLAAADHGADWVINNDADEFWWPLGGTLKDMLELVPSRYGQLTCPRYNFLPRSGEEPFWSRMIVRETVSHNLVGTELEPNVVHRAHPEVVVEHGNHWVHDERLVPAPPLPLIEVLHFPIRNYDQFEHKVVRAGMGYQALPDRPFDVGRDQLTLYEVHRRGGLREYFDRVLLDDDRIAAGVEQGELVVDRRLQRFLATGERSDSRPEAVAMARLAAEAFALAQRSRGLDETREQLSKARGEIDELVAELGHTRQVLDEVSAALQQLRDSRLVRASAGLRTLWYRWRGKRG